MTTGTREAALVRELVDRHGQTYAEQAGIKLADRPSPLYRLLVLLSGVDRWTSRALVALVVLSAAMVWVLVSVAIGFPARWEIVFQTLVGALTLAMVFVIQHTQSRQQAATQRKLDEILQALPAADNAL